MNIFFIILGFLLPSIVLSVPQIAQRAHGHGGFAGHGAQGFGIHGSMFTSGRSFDGDVFGSGTPEHPKFYNKTPSNS